MSSALTFDAHYSSSPPPPPTQKKKKKKKQNQHNYIRLHSYTKDKRREPESESHRSD